MIVRTVTTHADGSESVTYSLGDPDAVEGSTERHQVDAAMRDAEPTWERILESLGLVTTDDPAWVVRA